MAFWWQTLSLPDRECRQEHWFFLLPKVRQILTYFPNFMPTAPTRIKPMPPLLGSNSPVWVAVVESKTRGKTSFSHIQADSVTQDRVRKKEISRPMWTYVAGHHMVGATVCGFRRCVRFSWGWGFKIFQDLCPLVIRKNSFNVPGHLSENL